MVLSEVVWKIGVVWIVGVKVGTLVCNTCSRGEGSVLCEGLERGGLYTLRYSFCFSCVSRVFCEWLWEVGNCCGGGKAYWKDGGWIRCCVKESIISNTKSLTVCSITVCNHSNCWLNVSVIAIFLVELFLATSVLKYLSISASNVSLFFKTFVENHRGWEIF